VRGQLHALAAFSPGKETSDLLAMRLGGSERQSGGPREWVCAIRLCAIQVCAIRVCAIRLCAIRVCAIQVCAIRVCAISQVELEPHSSDVQPVVMTVIMAWTGTFHRLHTRQLSDHHTHHVAVQITKTRGNIG